MLNVLYMPITLFLQDLYLDHLTNAVKEALTDATMELEVCVCVCVRARACVCVCAC